jgi:D-psicose/D-tagatose/L-ribulose 3-epimerase
LRGGQVGKDIKIWRDLVSEQSEDKLDADVATSLVYLKNQFEV